MLNSSPEVWGKALALSDDGFTPWALQISVALHQLFVRARDCSIGFLIKLGAAASSGARPAGTNHAHTHTKQAFVGLGPVEVCRSCFCCRFFFITVLEYFISWQKQSCLVVDSVACLPAVYVYLYFWQQSPWGRRARIAEDRSGSYHMPYINFEG